MERLRKAASLSLADWIIMGQAWILFLVSELRLRNPPFRSMLAMSPTAAPRPSEHPISEPILTRYAWLVSIAGRYSPFHATCLKEAMVLSVLLGRLGIATQLRIGVARQEGKFKAHAWLEQNGQAISGMQGCDGYEPLVPQRGEVSAS